MCSPKKRRPRVAHTELLELLQKVKQRITIVALGLPRKEAIKLLEGLEDLMLLKLEEKNGK